MKFRTENSTYELDEARLRVRRLGGTKNPTPRQGVDGAWKTYASISAVSVSHPVWIDWDGEGHGTLTTPVVEIVS